MEQVDKVKQSDRRNYFRIDDVTIVYHRVLTENELDGRNHAEQLSIDKLTLKARFESLSREMKPMKVSVEDSNPKLAQYLEAIDKKLSMLSEVLMDSAIDELDADPQKVNISAGGLSFMSACPIVPGSILELRIILLPSNIGIYSQARVVSCKKDGNENNMEESYKIAVKFIHMDDEFRDQISRHVLSLERNTLIPNLKIDDKA